MFLEALQISATTLGLMMPVADVVQCRLAQAPEIFVRPIASPTEYNHRYTTKELTAKGSDTISPYPQYARTHTKGLTSSQIEMASELQFQIQSWPTLKLGCVKFARIEVTLKVDPTIYMSRDLKRRSCNYREVLSHEEKHVRVSKEILNKYARKIGEALRRAVNDKPARGPYPVERIPQIQEDMNAYISAVIKTQQALMQEEHFRAQQAIDSLEEYERIRLACS